MVDSRSRLRFWSNVAIIVVGVWLIPSSTPAVRLAYSGEQVESGAGSRDPGSPGSAVVAENPIQPTQSQKEPPVNTTFFGKVSAWWKNLFAR